MEYLENGGDSVILNCGYEKGYSVLEIANKMKTVSGRDFEILFKERRDGDVSIVVANSSLCRKKLNWVPKFNDIDLILKTSLEWEKKFHYKS